MTIGYSLYWQHLPLKLRSGADIFAALFLHSGEIATLLESPTTASYSPIGRYSIAAGSPRKDGKGIGIFTPEIGEIFPFLKQLQQPTIALGDFPSHLPFVGGWLGWLGYDAGREIETLPNLKLDPLPFPVAFWYEPETFAVLDRELDELWLAAASPEQLEAMISQLHEQTRGQGDRGTRGQGDTRVSFLTSQYEYETMVNRARDYIRAGDVFQANLSVRFAVETGASSWEIYRSLQQLNPSPFASYWQTPWGAVISCSPERLVTLRDRVAQTRPIAGTRPRGQTLAADRALEMELLDCSKENAEHIMLVDLERNDLGRVCQWGSVWVDEFMAIERYSHVMHLVSNVVGTLHDGCDRVDLMRAMFPGGTITGCPKVRCMEIIEELEPVRRNLFYGSAGYLDARGNLDLNILIRTLLYVPTGAKATVWGQVGAGIVADSDPTREWQESLQKARAQLAALGIY